MGGYTPETNSKLMRLRHSSESVLLLYQAVALIIIISSFVDRAKDTLKVSGVQVSPTEIEEVIRSHPGKLVVDVSVAGVSGGRTQDEKVPRAWIVLSEAGIARGEASVAEELNSWVKKNLSPYKWLRGGLEVVQEVCSDTSERSKLDFIPKQQIPKSPTGKVLRRHLQDKYEEQSKSRAKL